VKKLSDHKKLMEIRDKEAMRSWCGDEYISGFNKGAYEVMKQASKLVEALETEAEFLSLRGMLPLDKDHYILKALAEWKEFTK